MTRFQLKVGAAVLLLALAALLLQCAAFSDDAATCMRSQLTSLGLWALHWATLAFAVWLGMESSRASKRIWVGWVVGVLVLVVLNVGLSWMGFTLPATEIEDGSDNSYRR